ncbi:MAG TPA: ribonuclease E/G, partial [Actinomycetota bacterium]|nr:ribonuclease E/G [Actinomycetota bacterium]
MSDALPRKREKAADVARIDPAQDVASTKSAAPSRAPDATRRRRPARRRPRKPVREVERLMLVHGTSEAMQIAILENAAIVEHYVAHAEARSLVGNIYLGKVQNVLPGMDASFVEIGEARNGVLYASEVGIEGEDGDEGPRIETVLKPGQPILVQVTKDPMGSKGPRLTA